MSRKIIRDCDPTISLSTNAMDIVDDDDGDYEEVGDGNSHGEYDDEQDESDDEFSEEELEDEDNDDDDRDEEDEDAFDDPLSF